MMSSKRSSSSVAVIEGNDDLLIELILLYLPAKSLFRLKVVSKRWRSLISAPFFCRLHTVNHLRRRPETQPLVIMGGGGYRSKYIVYNPTLHRVFPFSFPLSFYNVWILHSCNGLLLLRRVKAEVGVSDSYHVLNPTTMQQRELPPLPSTGTVKDISLSFDPSFSLHYRVVCFVIAREGFLVSLIYYEYDSETHKWKIRGEGDKNAASLSNGGIYFCRVYYWFATSRRDSLDEMRSFNYAVESNGVQLCLYLDIKTESCVLNVCKKLKEDGRNRWSNEYQADMQPILSACGEQARDIRLLGIIRGEKEQDNSLILSLPRKKIVIYRFYDNAFEVDDYSGEEFLKGSPLWCVSDAYHFIYTLAPI